MGEQKLKVVIDTQQGLAERYRAIRQTTERLAESVTAEDAVVQSMPDASPTKWHLAHTSWFFETLVLSSAVKDYQAYHPMYSHLFNSYYQTIGDPYAQRYRGLLSRPTNEEVMAYRHYVDLAMLDFLNNGSDDLTGPIKQVIETGFHHEEQHQELILTDIKHLFSCNPLRPAYQKKELPRLEAIVDLDWWECPKDRYEIGHAGPGFSYDNEGPRHEVLLNPFAMATRLVTNGEYLEFIDDGGYGRPDFWLSDGWKKVLEEGWDRPLYWERRKGKQSQMTLLGVKEIDLNAPVCHVSFYEADAYARWKGLRLPSEAEWEVASRDQVVSGNLLERNYLHPIPVAGGGTREEGPTQLFGDVWEWTASAYGPYPGYRVPAGALGEYNGKFMCNQMVLRGGSCVTPRAHIRATYRNFWAPEKRWQFTGIRLARDPS
jgi:ergothioneine biosynthesis protein EgtB